MVLVNSLRTTKNIIVVMNETFPHFFPILLQRKTAMYYYKYIAVEN